MQNKGNRYRHYQLILGNELNKRIPVSVHGAGRNLASADIMLYLL